MTVTVRYVTQIPVPPDKAVYPQNVFTLKQTHVHTWTPASPITKRCNLFCGAPAADSNVLNCVDEINVYVVFLAHNVR